jgi:hypothetical protein
VGNRITDASVSSQCALCLHMKNSYGILVFHALGMIPPEDHGLFVVNVRKNLVITSMHATFSTTEPTKLTEFVRRLTKNWKTIVT